MVSTLVTISVPLELFREIDEKRGQVSSSFCLKLIETGLKNKETFE